MLRGRIVLKVCCREGLLFVFSRVAIGSYRLSKEAVSSRWYHTLPVRTVNNLLTVLTGGVRFDVAALAS